MWDLQLERPNKPALGVALSKSEAKKSAKDSSAEEESKWLAEEVAGEGKKSDEGSSEGNVV